MNPILVFSLWCLGGFVVGVVFGSFFEWTLHRYVMHRPIWNFRYAFQAHAVVHHQVFKADQTYVREDGSTLNKAKQRIELSAEGPSAS